MRRLRRLAAAAVVMAALAALPVCVWAEAQQEDIQAAQEYDYSEIDSAIMQNSGCSISFQEIIDSITQDNAVTGKGILQAADRTFLQVLASGKTAVVQIILLALFSASVKCFGLSAGKEQISDIAQMLLSISLISVLIASFYSAYTISVNLLESCVAVYKAAVPVFFSAVAFSCGSVTAAAYYELVLLMITAVNIFFKNVLLKMSQIYLLLSMADAAAKEAHFTKAAGLASQFIKWSCRTAILVFTGLGGIKGMVIPAAESYKKNMVYRAFQTLPGVGNSIEAVSQTVLSAAGVIKNGIGAAAMLTLVIICFIPVLKLVMLSVLFKVTAAVIEPVSDKRIVKAVNSLSVAVGMLLVIVLAAVSLFLLMTAVVVLAAK